MLSVWNHFTYFSHSKRFVVYFFEGNYSDYEENRKKRLGDVAPKRIKYRKIEGVGGDFKPIRILKSYRVG